MIKILWICPWFGNYRVPVYNELKRLSNDNFYQICSKPGISPLIQQKLIEGLGEHVSIMEGAKVLTIGDPSSTFANKALFLKYQPGLYSKIKEINPDVIIVEGFGSWSPYGIFYAILHRKKICMFYERTAQVERNCPWYRTLYRKIIGRFVDTFFINGKLCEDYVSNGLGFDKVPKVKGCMVADSTELSKLVAQVNDVEINDLRKALNLNSGMVYLFVGQLVERKGVIELLNAWMSHVEKFPNDNMLIIGSGHLETKLHEKYDGEKSINILGNISYDRIHYYYKLCDVFVMPTLEDNWCLVVPEAMACGKPIACSLYNGGHYELVHDGINGYRFDSLDNESIVNVLGKFHTADLIKMGQESIRIEKAFSPENAATNMFNAIKKLLK